jgi:hemolysin III
MIERAQTKGEEIANSVSHGVALLAAIVGAPFLIVAARDFGAANVVGASVFAGTMILLYLASTV